MKVSYLCFCSACHQMKKRIPKLRHSWPIRRKTKDVTGLIDIQNNVMELYKNTGESLMVSYLVLMGNKQNHSFFAWFAFYWKCESYQY